MSIPGPIPARLILDGEWDFGYEPAFDSGIPKPPAGGQFAATMPVPAYWDDHLDRLAQSPFWDRTRFNPECRPIVFPSNDSPPNASLPWLEGIGWYRKVFSAPEDWRERCVG